MKYDRTGNQFSSSLILTFLLPILITAQINSPTKPLLNKYTQNTPVRLIGIHNGNQITTEFWNYGSISSPGNRMTDIVWEGLGYGSEFGMFVCAEVEVPPQSHTDAYVKLDSLGNPIIEANGDTVWAVRMISDGLVSFPERSPDFTELWTWEPLPGFAAPSPNESVAMSNHPLTWPTEWSEWSGKFGNGVILADQESYWMMDDRYNKEFEYYPLPDDTTIRGLGLEVSCRGYQWNNVLAKDFLVFTYDIKNVSTNSLNQVQVGFWGDPHIGGPSNWDDDLSFFNLELDMAYAWDEDGISDIEGVTPGYFGLKFLDTPSDVGLQSFSAPLLFAQNSPRNDHHFWENFLQPGIFDSSNATVSGDNMFIVGSGYFSLDPGETGTFAVAVVLGKDYDDLIFNTINAQNTYIQQIQYSSNADPHEVNVTFPSLDSELSGTAEIIWSSASSTGNPLSVDIYYNLNRGDGWQILATNEPDDGSYLWDTSPFSDGYNYQLRIMARDSLSIGYQISDYFIVNNPQNQSDPEILLLDPVDMWFLSGTAEITWRAGDADGTPVNINIYYTMYKASTWYLLAENETNDGSYLWDTTQFPNGLFYWLKLAVTDGLSEFESPPSSVFGINNSYPELEDSSVVHVEGKGSGSIEVSIVDPSATTGHLYQLTFDDTTESFTTYDVLDLNNNQFVIEDAPQLTSNLTGPLFDGLRLAIQDESLELDTSETGWNATSASNYTHVVKPFNNLHYKQYPADYEIRFFDTLVDSSSQTGKGYIKANFQVWEVTKGSEPTKLRMVILELSHTRDSLWTPGERVVILQGEETSTTSWEFILSEPLSGDTIAPTNGDVFLISTKKPFTHKDVFEIQSPVLSTIPDVSNNLPGQFQLFQNYPNPFNPATTILYELTEPTNVQLIIYDLLGQEIVRLVDDYQNADKYSLYWNGTNTNGKPVASGIYFYRLKTENLILTKKMVLLK